MKRRVWKMIGLAAAGGVLLQVGTCSYFAEAIWYNLLYSLISQLIQAPTT